MVALTCNTCGEETLNPVNQYLKKIFSMMGYSDAGYIWQNFLLLPDDLAKHPEKIREAIKLGKSLVP